MEAVLSRLPVFKKGVNLVLDERSRMLIEKLVERSTVETSVIMSDKQITRRQLEYSIEKLNLFLEENKQPIITYDDSMISLDKKSREFFITIMLSNEFTEDYIFSSEERKKYIFFMLFYYSDNYLSQQHFLSELKIGKTTFSSDLRKLEAELFTEGITIRYTRKDGYSLIGDEMNIRYHLMRMIIIDFSTNTNRILYDHFFLENQVRLLDKFEHFLDEQMEKYNIRLVENRKEEFMATFLLLVPRLDREIEEFYEKYNFSMFLEMDEYFFATALLDEFSVNNKYAAHYICAWILGISVGNPEKETKDHSIILELVERITHRFEILSGIRFKNREIVIQRLFNHFRPTYYRLFFKLPIVNPLSVKIKMEYKDLYEIVNETLKPITALFEYTIPEEEIAFLTIHFAAMISEYDEVSVKQKVALIVCPNGIGSSSIVYTELKATFPEFIFIGPVETNAVANMASSYDVIFTTVPNVRLFALKRPVYVVSPIMNTEEKYDLIRDVYTEVGSLTFRLPSVPGILSIVEKHAKIQDSFALEKELYSYLIESDASVRQVTEEGPSLWETIDVDCIQLQLHVQNWEEAIYMAAAPMVNKGIILREYVDKIIQTVKKEGAYMLITKHVALPHARPSDGALKLGLGITTLKKPILFEGAETNPVKYIFTLSAIDNTKHINAIAKLVQLIDKKEFFSVLDKSTDSRQILDYIKAHS